MKRADKLYKVTEYDNNGTIKNTYIMEWYRGMPPIKWYIRNYSCNVTFKRL